MAQVPTAFHPANLTERPKNPGVLWVHNDKGNPSEVFALDTNGTLLGTYTLGGVTAVDFEDMAIGTVNGVDYLYIADTGDNNARDGKTPVRTTVAIYRVPEPDVSTIPNGTLTGVQTLEVEYPGSAYDCETLLVDPLTGDIVLVTRDGANPFVSHVFSYPAPPLPPGNPPTFTLLEHPTLPTTSQVKGGDVSRDGSQVLLRLSDNGTTVDGLLWNRPVGTPLSPLCEVFGDQRCPVPLVGEPKGEAVSFNAAGTGYYTISESEGADQPVSQGHPRDLGPISNRRDKRVLKHRQ